MNHAKLEDYDLCKCPNCDGTGETMDDRDDADGVATMRAGVCRLCDGVGDIHHTKAVGALFDGDGWNDNELTMCWTCGLVHLTGKSEEATESACPLCAAMAAALDKRERDLEDAIDHELDEYKERKLGLP